MRFKNFLAEDSSLFSFDDVIKRIKVECKPFLAQRDGLLMYRGISRKVIQAKQSQAFFTRHPVDRPALDSGPQFNAMFNLGVESAFGIEKVRTHSFFATGSVITTTTYGAPNYIFPKGDFEILWSPEIKDSYAQHQWITAKLGQALKKINVKYYELDVYLDDAQLAKLLEILSVNQNTPNEELVKLIYSARANKFPSISNDIIAALKQVFQDLYRTDNLGAALRSEREIMIYKSKGYYTIPMALTFAPFKESGETTESGFFDKVLS